MSEAFIVVCDVCGKPAIETVSLKVAARGYQKDLCQEHLDELLKDARAPRRGRPRTKPVAGGRKPVKRKASTRRTKTPSKRASRKKAS
jgi:hypothetical protein